MVLKLLLPSTPRFHILAISPTQSLPNNYGESCVMNQLMSVEVSQLWHRYRLGWKCKYFRSVKILYWLKMTSSSFRV